jgi:hypothetical protein
MDTLAQAVTFLKHEEEQPDLDSKVHQLIYSKIMSKVKLCLQRCCWQVDGVQEEEDVIHLVLMDAIETQICQCSANLWQPTVVR